MRDRIRCAHCCCLFFPDPRVKNQRYCGKKACQRARKSLWQKEKLARDPHYRQNQQDSTERWRRSSPDYWKAYREDHPDYTKRNRELQKLRDSKRRLSRDLAKMDASPPHFPVKQGTYYLIPDAADLAKMDASTQKVCLIPIT